MLRLAAIIMGSLALAGAAHADAPRVKVESGVLVGAQTDRARIFRNVPYAAPPVGELRWAPPKRPLAWKGERDADQNGPSCPQKMNADGSPNEGSANGPVSEDCLQLNVFAPLEAKKAPVMVWLHGGGHKTGAGWIYDGQNFARDGVVLVAINYRLGPLGYFAHPALGKDQGGNYGLMDQVAALQWVKRNIAAFGGDPANVTVFGESAGGASTLAILAAPGARGLFHKAAVQSGGGWSRPVTLAAKEAEGAALASKLGATDLAQLRALPAQALADEGAQADYGPFVDGRWLKETPAQAFAAGRAADVPLIVGANSGEDSLLGRRLPDADTMAAAIPGSVKAAYPDEAAKGDEALVRAAFGDRYMVAPARWLAAQAAGGKPAWLYHFSYVGSRFRPLGVTTAAHAAEIQYVFEYWGRRTPESMVAADDRAMAGLMHGCWVAFARTGAPKCDIAWPAYDRARDELVEFGAQSGLRAGFRKPQLDAQQALVLPGLALPEN
ncbi:carboxylesterase family protein [Phenylobacterium sp.]|uniref:carboxylesterase/lipase family protein n=1 Tax=Phenylobacterium sp. TaxID=1871053 RepID=UPI0028A2C9AA|nr:carboxylesterase family protein [Phenylobacterium sp.]